MTRRRFTPSDVASFQWAVARGAKAVDVAREHRFSPSNFHRWARSYGRPVVAYEPTDADRARARGWRKARTLAEAWRLYRDFASSGPWADNAELPAYDEDGDSPESQRLTLQTVEDARVLLVCEKLLVQNQLETWNAPGEPSMVHRTRAALAWVPALPSRWVAETLVAHAKALGARLFFFGDLDPQALHAFAALRAGGRNALLRGGSMRRVRVTWLGIDSGWLAWTCREFGVRDVPPRMTIRLSWLDQEYWQLVKRLVPDAHRLLGARAFALLNGGAKIEADAMQGKPFVEEFGRRLERTL
jgi:hypothetical protein